MTRDLDPLRAPYRPVRPVGAPDDGPWPGMLTCLTSGERRVLVDAVVLGTGWRGWDAAPDGHVLAPLDVVRRAGGHDVALSVCTERVGDFIARRRAQGLPLSAGESVTLGVSIVRGCAELRDAQGAVGEWWLTEAGRPVLATDASTRPVREGAASLLAELAPSSHTASVWTEAATVVGADRSPASDYERIEAALFEVAEPRPLTMEVHAPRLARAVAASEWRDDPPESAAGRPRLWEVLGRHVDADLAEIVSKATTGIWRRSREGRGHRRAPLALAGGAAAAVLGVGLMWPAGDGSSATAGAPAEAAPSSTHSAAATPSAPSSEGAGSGGAGAGGVADSAEPDLVGVLGVLLDERRACGAERDCLSRVMRDPSATWDAGPVDHAPDARDVVLLDDFGGVAVLRVDDRGGRSPSQLVVIERLNDEWLLRDVHDVAQQP